MTHVLSCVKVPDPDTTHTWYYEPGRGCDPDQYTDTAVYTELLRAYTHADIDDIISSKVPGHAIMICYLSTIIGNPY